MLNFTNRDKASPAALKRLSDKAFSVYAEYDPIDIYFKEGKYYLRGVFEADEMTFEEMDKFFSDIAAAMGR